MPTQLLQSSVAAGEVDPRLYQRVDLAKWHIGVKTMLNWYVHAQGGASNRPGTGWVGEEIDSTKLGRLIPFQFSTIQTYVLEFGDFKMRVIKDGGYVLETAKTITGATQANPCNLTITGHSFSNGDRIYVQSVAGMTQLNNRFFTVTVVDANHITIGVNSTGYTAYTSGGTAARVYTKTSPYAYADLPLLKYEQSADTMTLTHKSYAPYKLTRSSHTSWTFTSVTFAPTQQPPSNVSSSAAGSTYFYGVTAINDSTGEESLQSVDCGSSSTSSTLTWSALLGASTYSVYRKTNGVYGFIGTAQAPVGGGSTTFTDASIVPDTSTTPPQQRNPFGNGKITAVVVQSGGSSYSAPTVAAVDQSGTGATFTAHVSGGVITSVDVNKQGTLYSPNATLQITDGGGVGAAIQIVVGDDGSGINNVLLSATVVAGGSGYHSGAYALVQPTSVNGGAAISITVGGGAVTSVAITNVGVGLSGDSGVYYAQIFDAVGTGGILIPTITPDPTTYPGVNTYHDGRQWFAATAAQPQTLWGSVSGAFNNMSVSVPTRDSDAITRTLASRQVNDIKHIISLTQMILLTGGAEWKVSAGTADVITPAQFVARPQSYNGSSDIRPIVVNEQLLYIPGNERKVRNLQYQWAADVWSGTDLSLLSAHLFEASGSNNNQLVNWQYARDPESIIWAIRDDGTLLGFTYLNDQQVYAWHRHTMSNGIFEDVCCIQEGDETAVYFIIRRTINGQTVRYIERLHTRVFATIADAWFLDCAAQYSGSAATTINGLWHLIGETVYAMADGIPVGPFTVSAGGSITLSTAASKVTVGKLMPNVDIETISAEQQDQAGTLQGRKKKVNHVTLGLKNSANQGLNVGPSGGQATVQYQIKPKDLVNPLATAPSTAPALITDVMHQVAAPSWDWYGRIKISATLPLPYTITGIMYDITAGS